MRLSLLLLSLAATAHAGNAEPDIGIAIDRPASRALSAASDLVFYIGKGGGGTGPAFHDPSPPIALTDRAALFAECDKGQTEMETWLTDHAAAVRAWYDAKTASQRARLHMVCAEA